MPIVVANTGTSAIKSTSSLFNLDMAQSGLYFSYIALGLYVAITLFIIMSRVNDTSGNDLFKDGKLSGSGYAYIGIPAVCFAFQILAYILYALLKKKNQRKANLAVGHVSFIPIYLAAVALIILIAMGSTNYYSVY
jgi:hypothetical protein